MKKHIRFFFILFFCLLLLFFLVFFGIQNKKYQILRIACYDLPSYTVEALSKAIDNSGFEYELTILDNTKDLLSYIQIPVSYDLLFTLDSKNFESISTQVKNPETETLLKINNPVRISVQYKNRLIGTPLFSDQFQLFYNKELIIAEGHSFPTHFSEIEAILHKNTSSAINMVCAGGDDYELLSFFTALIESKFGKELYDSSVIELSTIETSTTNINSASFDSFFQKSEIKTILEMLREWEASEILYPFWLSTDLSQMELLIKTKKPRIICSNLSSAGVLNIINTTEYESFFFPFSQSTTSKYLVSDTLVGAILSVPKSPFETAGQATEKAIKAKKVLESIASNPSQENISKELHLIPTNITTPMINSIAEYKSWIDGSTGVISSIGTAAFMNQKSTQFFAEALRNQLKNIFPSDKKQS
jgi:hypothetical protein